MRIVCAVSTPFQVNFFEELVKRDGENEYLFAARDRDATLSMLEDKNLPFRNLGGYEGSSLDLKLKEFAKSLMTMGKVIEDFDPQLVLTERYPPAVHAAHLVKIPCWTIFNDEREFHVNRLTHPLAAKVFVPSFYEYEMIRGQGVLDEEMVVWFYGFITCYLKGAKLPEKNPFVGMDGFEEGSPVILVRPEFEFSVFFEGYKPILEGVVRSLLNDFDVNIVILPRTPDQRKRYRKIGALVPERALDGNPVASSDVVLGSAETMLCEAFTLGVPAVSCIYWDLTVPMQELHKYIPRSTDPKEVSKLVSEYIESSESRDHFKRLSRSVIKKMDNPVDTMCDLLASWS